MAFRIIDPGHFSSLRTSTRRAGCRGFSASPAVTSNRSVRLAAPENARRAAFCSKKTISRRASGQIRSAAMSGGHRNATAPNSSASALNAFTIARYGAEDWHRLAMPGPRPNSIVSSARSTATVQPAASVTWELAEAIRCRRRHYHVTVVNSATISATANIKTATSIRQLPHGARPLGSCDGPCQRLYRIGLHQ